MDSESKCKETRCDHDRDEASAAKRHDHSKEAFHAVYNLTAPEDSSRYPTATAIGFALLYFVCVDCSCKKILALYILTYLLLIYC